MPYGSAMTDVWSLGILLLNMVTAQNPWKHAHPNENAFMIYQREPKAFLGRMFPISEELQASICWALELNAVKRCTVQEFCRSVLSCERLHQPCTNAVPVACDPITSNKTLQVNTQVAQQNTVTADAVSCREENNIFVKGSVSASNQRAYEWSNQIDEQGDSGFESGDTYVGRNEMPMYNKLNSNICDVNDICAIFNHYYLDDEAFEISEIVPGQQGKSLEASVNHPHIVDKSQTLISANGIKKALFAKRSPLLNQATLKSNDFCCTSITIPNKKCRRNPRHQNPSKSFWRFDAVRDLFVRRQAS
jgi:serine/threonine protein kinase